MKKKKKTPKHIGKKKTISSEIRSLKIRNTKAEKDTTSKIRSLKIRNTKVEKNTTWETSLTRKITIAILMYFFMALFFYVSKFPNPFISAIVPTLGFILSTLSLKLFKKIWIRNIYK